MNISRSFFGPVVPLLAALCLFVGSVALAQPVNVAPLGTATQSSECYGMPASRGNDGNLTNFTHTCNFASGGAEPVFWEVDLGAVRTIQQIVVHNRDDCCQLRLRDITVTIIDADGSTVNYDSGLLNPGDTLGGPATLDIDLTAGPIDGKTVRVVRTPDPALADDDAEVLVLGEVEVIVDNATLPAAILTQPQGRNSFVGECVVFSVDIFNEHKVTAIQWQKNTVDIPGATDTRLVVADVQSADAGTYTVVLTTDAGDLTSDPAVLNVLGLNLGVHGTATQSSMGWGGVAGRAIDGNTNGVYGAGTTTHTQDHKVDGEPGPCWWQVDLLGASTVDKVIIWGRTDACCLTRLTSFRVSFLDAGGVEITGSDHFTDLTYPTTTTAGYEVTPAAPVTGCSTVKLERLGPEVNGSIFLSLAEVQIMGSGPVPPPSPYPNLARGCGVLASHSSQLGGYHAGLAANGNRGDFTHTINTDDNATWQIDLAQPTTIERINVYNRTSCCGSRLRDITVSVLDADASIVWESVLLNPENELGEFPLGPDRLVVDLRGGAAVTGQIVRIHRTPDPDFSGGGDGSNLDEGVILSLGEVEIFGIAPIGQLAGDCNQDAVLNIADVICGIKLIFANFLLLDRTPQLPPCATNQGNLKVMDVNGDSALDVNDIVFTAQYLFNGGAAPVQGPQCFAVLPGDGCEETCVPY